MAAVFASEETARAATGVFGPGAGPGAEIRPALVRGIDAATQDPALLASDVSAVTPERFIPGSNGKLIVLMRDAHANLSAQKNLHKAIDFWSRGSGIDLVLSEAAWGEAGLSDAQSGLSAKDLKLAADRLLWENLITGHEYQTLVSKRPVRIVGVEDPELYRRSREVFRRMVLGREKALRSLVRARALVDEMKRRDYPKELLEFEASFASAGPAASADMDWSKRYREIRRLAAASAAPLSSDAQKAVEPFLQLEAMEKSIDPARLALEQEQALAQARANCGACADSLLRSFEKAGTSIAALESAVGQLALASGRERWDAGSEMGRYAAYLRSAGSLRVEPLISALEFLEEELYASAAGSRAARVTRFVDRHTRLLENAYRLRLTPDDTERLEAELRSVHPVSWQAEVNDRLLERGNTDDLLEYLPELASRLTAVRNFYRLAALRDQVFVRRSGEALAASGETAAVLVTGGYHTSRLADLFAERGYSVAVFTPYVAHETDQAAYERSVLSGDPARSSLLAPLVRTPEGSARLDSAVKTGAVLSPAARTLAARLAALSAAEPTARTAPAVPAVSGARMTIEGDDDLDWDAPEPPAARLIKDFALSEGEAAQLIEWAGGDGRGIADLAGYEREPLHKVNVHSREAFRRTYRVNLSFTARDGAQAVTRSTIYLKRFEDAYGSPVSEDHPYIFDLADELDKEQRLTALAHAKGLAPRTVRIGRALVSEESQDAGFDAWLEESAAEGARRADEVLAGIARALAELHSIRERTGSDRGLAHGDLAYYWPSDPDIDDAEPTYAFQMEHIRIPQDDRPVSFIDLSQASFSSPEDLRAEAEFVARNLAHTLGDVMAEERFLRTYQEHLDPAGSAVASEAGSEAGARMAGLVTAQEDLARDILERRVIDPADVEVLARQALRDLGDAYQEEILDETDVRLLVSAIRSDPLSFVWEGRFDEEHFRDKVRDLMNVSIELRPRLIERLDRYRNQEERFESDRIYIEGEATPFDVDGIEALGEEVLDREYDHYRQFIVPSLPKDTNVLKPLSSGLAYRDFGLDWIRSEAVRPDGTHRYYTSTVADSSQIPSRLRRIERQIDRYPGRPVVYTSFERQLRKEDPDRILEGWRQHIFGQIDVKTYARDPDDRTQQAMDIWTVTHLVQVLRSIGVEDGGIRIRMNDHWGILGRLLQLSGLSLIEIRSLRPLFNGLAEARASEDPDRIEAAKRRLMAEISVYQTRYKIGSDVMSFLKWVVDKKSFRTDLISNQFPEVASRVRRLIASANILQDLYRGTGIRIELEPVIFINEKDSGLGGQADITVDNRSYNEVASFAANMSHRRREGVYLSSAAIGMTRLVSVLTEHDLTAKWIDPIEFEDVLSEVVSFRGRHSSEAFDAPVPFQRVQPGFDPSLPVIRRHGSEAGARMAGADDLEKALIARYAHYGMTAQRGAPIRGFHENRVALGSRDAAGSVGDIPVIWLTFDNTASHDPRSDAHRTPIYGRIGEWRFASLDLKAGIEDLVRDPETLKKIIYIPDLKSSLTNVTDNLAIFAAAAAMGVASVDLEDRVFLDQGSADGILSVLALRKGARRAILIDMDPEMRMKALKLAQANGISADRIVFLERDLNDSAELVEELSRLIRPEERARMVVASNIGDHQIYPLGTYLNAIEAARALGAQTLISGGHFMQLDRSAAVLADAVWSDNPDLSRNSSWGDARALIEGRMDPYDFRILGGKVLAAAAAPPAYRLTRTIQWTDENLPDVSGIIPVGVFERSDAPPSAARMADSEKRAAARDYVRRHRDEFLTPIHFFESTDAFYIFHGGLHAVSTPEDEHAGLVDAYAIENVDDFFFGSPEWERPADFLERDAQYRGIARASAAAGIPIYLVDTPVIEPARPSRGDIEERSKGIVRARAAVRVTLLALLLAGLARWDPLLGVMAAVLSFHFYAFRLTPKALLYHRWFGIWPLEALGLIDGAAVGLQRSALAAHKIESIVLPHLDRRREGGKPLIWIDWGAAHADMVPMIRYPWFRKAVLWMEKALHPFRREIKPDLRYADQAVWMRYGDGSAGAPALIGRVIGPDGAAVGPTSPTGARMADDRPAGDLNVVTTHDDAAWRRAVREELSRPMSDHAKAVLGPLMGNDRADVESIWRALLQEAPSGASRWLERLWPGALRYSDVFERDRTITDADGYRGLLRAYYQEARLSHDLGGVRLKRDPRLLAVDQPYQTLTLSMIIKSWELLDRLGALHLVPFMAMKNLVWGGLEWFFSEVLMDETFSVSARHAHLLSAPFFEALAAHELGHSVLRLRVSSDDAFSHPDLLVLHEFFAEIFSLAYLERVHPEDLENYYRTAYAEPEPDQVRGADPHETARRLIREIRRRAAASGRTVWNDTLTDLTRQIEDFAARGRLGVGTFRWTEFVGSWPDRTGARMAGEVEVLGTAQRILAPVPADAAAATVAFNDRFSVRIIALGPTEESQRIRVQMLGPAEIPSAVPARLEIDSKEDGPASRVQRALAALGALSKTVLTAGRTKDVLWEADYELSPDFDVTAKGLRHLAIQFLPFTKGFVSSMKLADRSDGEVIENLPARFEGQTHSVLDDAQTHALYWRLFERWAAGHSDLGTFGGIRVRLKADHSIGRDDYHQVDRWNRTITIVGNPYFNLINNMAAELVNGLAELGYSDPEEARRRFDAEVRPEWHPMSARTPDREIGTNFYISHMLEGRSSVYVETIGQGEGWKRFEVRAFPNDRAKARGVPQGVLFQLTVRPDVMPEAVRNAVQNLLDPSIEDGEMPTAHDPAHLLGVAKERFGPTVSGLEVGSSGARMAGDIGQRSAIGPSRRTFLGQLGAMLLGGSVLSGSGSAQDRPAAPLEGRTPDPQALDQMLRFLELNTFEGGIPMSFRAPEGYWRSIGSDPDQPEAMVERLMIGESGKERSGSVNVYDGSLWQIWMARNGRADAADRWTEVLRSGSLGEMTDIRAYREPFAYGPAQVKPEKDQAFVFRSISPYGLQTDPLDGKTESESFPDGGKLKHVDWKPVAGENAWALFIGPLQSAAAKYRNGWPAADPEELKIGIRALRTVEAMQSPNGAIYHVPAHTAGKSASDIFIENNASMYAALRMLERTIAARPRNAGNLSGPLAAVRRVLSRMDRFWKDHSFDRDRNVFHTGLTEKDGRPVPTGEFAVDAQTWTVAVLGPEWIVREIGGGDEGIVHRILTETKRRAGSFKNGDPNGELIGLGFTDGHDVISGEWTAGGILAWRVAADHYQKLYARTRDERHKAWAIELWNDARTMRDGLEALKVPQADGSLAYQYADRRVWIPFGWWGNPIPSLASTAWVAMIDSGFNPFVLGGGSIPSADHELLGLPKPSGARMSIPRRALLAGAATGVVGMAIPVSSWAARTGMDTERGEGRAAADDPLEAQLASVKDLAAYARELPGWIDASRKRRTLAADLPRIRARWDALLTAERDAARTDYETKEKAARDRRVRTLRSKIEQAQSPDARGALYAELADALEPKYGAQTEGNVHWARYFRVSHIANIDTRLRNLEHPEFMTRVRAQLEEERIRRGLTRADLEVPRLLRQVEFEVSEGMTDDEVRRTRKAEADALLRRTTDWERLEDLSYGWRIGVERKALERAAADGDLGALIKARLSALAVSGTGKVAGLARRIRSEQERLAEVSSVVDRQIRGARYFLAQAAQAGMTSANSDTTKVAPDQVGKGIVLPGVPSAGVSSDLIRLAPVRPVDNGDPREYYEASRAKRSPFFKIEETYFDQTKTSGPYVHLLDEKDLPADAAAWLADAEHGYWYFDPNTGRTYGRFMDLVVLDDQQRFVAGVYFTGTDMGGNYPRDIYPRNLQTQNPDLYQILTRPRGSPDERMLAFRYLLPASEIERLKKRREQRVKDRDLHPESEWFFVDTAREPETGHHYVYFWEGEDLLRHAGGEKVLVVPDDNGLMKSLEARKGPDGKFAEDSRGRREQKIYGYRPTDYQVVTGTSDPASSGDPELLLEALQRELMLIEGGAMAYDPEYEDRWTEYNQRLVGKEFKSKVVLDEVRYLPQTHIHTGLASYLKWEDALRKMVYSDARAFRRSSAEEKKRSDFLARMKLFEKMIYRNDRGHFHMLVPSPRLVERQAAADELEFLGLRSDSVALRRQIEGLMGATGSSGARMADAALPDASELDLQYYATWRDVLAEHPEMDYADHDMARQEEHEGLADGSSLWQAGYYVVDGKPYLAFEPGAFPRVARRLWSYESARRSGFTNLAEVRLGADHTVLTRLAQSYSDEELLAADTDLEALFVYMLLYGDWDHAPPAEDGLVNNVYRRTIALPQGGVRTVYLVIDNEHAFEEGPYRHPIGTDDHAWTIAKNFFGHQLDRRRIHGLIDRLNLSRTDRREFKRHAETALKRVDSYYLRGGARMASVPDWLQQSLIDRTSGITRAQRHPAIQKELERIARERDDDGPIDVAVFGPGLSRIREGRLASYQLMEVLGVDPRIRVTVVDGSTVAGELLGSELQYHAIPISSWLDQEIEGDDVNYRTLDADQVRARIRQVVREDFSNLDRIRERLGLTGSGVPDRFDAVIATNSLTYVTGGTPSSNPAILDLLSSAVKPDGSVILDLYTLNELLTDPIRPRDVPDGPIVFGGQEWNREYHDDRSTVVIRRALFDPHSQDDVLENGARMSASAGARPDPYAIGDHRIGDPDLVGRLVGEAKANGALFATGLSGIGKSHTWRREAARENSRILHISAAGQVHESGIIRQAVRALRRESPDADPAVNADPTMSADEMVRRIGQRTLLIDGLALLAPAAEGVRLKDLIDRGVPVIRVVRSRYRHAQEAYRNFEALSGRSPGIVILAPMSEEAYRTSLVSGAAREIVSALRAPGDGFLPRTVEVPDEWKPALELVSAKAPIFYRVTGGNANFTGRVLDILFERDRSKAAPPVTEQLTRVFRRIGSVRSEDDLAEWIRSKASHWNLLEHLLTAFEASRADDLRVRIFLRFREPIPVARIQAWPSDERDRVAEMSRLGILVRDGDSLRVNGWTGAWHELGRSAERRNGARMADDPAEEKLRQGSGGLFGWTFAATAALHGVTSWWTRASLPTPDDIGRNGLFFDITHHHERLGDWWTALHATAGEVAGFYSRLLSMDYQIVRGDHAPPGIEWGWYWLLFVPAAAAYALVFKRFGPLSRFGSGLALGGWFANHLEGSLRGGVVTNMIQIRSSESVSITNTADIAIAVGVVLVAAAVAVRTARQLAAPRVSAARMAGRLEWGNLYRAPAAHWPWASLYHWLVRDSVEVVGIENIPPGKAILAGNHVSSVGTDGVIVATEAGLRIGRVPQFVVQSEALGLLTWFLAWAGGFIPVKPHETARTMVRRLDTDGAPIIGIFPAGRPSKSVDRNVKLFDASAVARVAFQTGTPVVPFYTESTLPYQRSAWGLLPGFLMEKLHLRRKGSGGKVRIVLGNAIRPSDHGSPEGLMTELKSSVLTLAGAPSVPSTDTRSADRGTADLSAARMSAVHTGMTTFDGRLATSEEVAASLLRKGDRVLEVGVGMFPYTVANLADRVPHVSIDAVDHALPSVVLVSGDKLTRILVDRYRILKNFRTAARNGETVKVVFDQTGEPVTIEADSAQLYDLGAAVLYRDDPKKMEQYEALKQELKARLAVRQYLKKYEVPRSDDPAHANIKVDPDSNLWHEAPHESGFFARPNVRYYPADVVQQDAAAWTRGAEALGSYRLIRDFNLSAAYFTAEKKSAVYARYASLLQEGGYLMVGRSANDHYVRGAHTGERTSEFVLYRKVRGTLTPISFTFTVAPNPVEALDSPGAFDHKMTGRSEVMNSLFEADLRSGARPAGLLGSYQRAFSVMGASAPAGKRPLTYVADLMIRGEFYPRLASILKRDGYRTRVEREYTTRRFLGKEWPWPWDGRPIAMTVFFDGKKFPRSLAERMMGSDAPGAVRSDQARAPQASGTPAGARMASVRIAVVHPGRMSEVKRGRWNDYRENIEVLNFGEHHLDQALRSLRDGQTGILVLHLKSDRLEHDRPSAGQIPDRIIRMIERPEGTASAPVIINASDSVTDEVRARLERWKTEGKIAGYTVNMESDHLGLEWLSNAYPDRVWVRKRTPTSGGWNVRARMAGSQAVITFRRTPSTGRSFADRHPFELRVNFGADPAVPDSTTVFKIASEKDVELDGSESGHSIRIHRLYEDAPVAETAKALELFGFELQGPSAGARLAVSKAQDTLDPARSAPDRSPRSAPFKKTYQTSTAALLHQPARPEDLASARPDTEAARVLSRPGARLPDAFALNLVTPAARTGTGMVAPRRMAAVATKVPGSAHLTFVAVMPSGSSAQDPAGDTGPGSSDDERMADEIRWQARLAGAMFMQGIEMRGQEAYAIHEISGYEAAEPSPDEEGTDPWIAAAQDLADGIQKNPEWHVRFTYKGRTITDRDIVDELDGPEAERLRKVIDILQPYHTEHFPYAARVIGDLTLSEARAEAASLDPDRISEWTGAMVFGDDRRRTAILALFLQMALSSKDDVVRSEEDPLVEMLRVVTQRPEFTARDAENLRTGDLRAIERSGSGLERVVVRVGARLSQAVQRALKSLTAVRTSA